MLINSPSIHERIVTDLGPNTHHRILEHSLPVDFFLLLEFYFLLLFISEINDLECIIKFFIFCQGLKFSSCLHRFFIQSLFLPFNLIVKSSFSVKLSRSFATINCIKCLHQESQQDIHLILIFNDEINSSC